MNDLTHLGALSTRDSNRAAIPRGLRCRLTNPPCAKPQVGWLQFETEYVRVTSMRERQKLLQRGWTICGTCPTSNHAALAVADRHTGLAAGDAHRIGHGRSGC